MSNKIELLPILLNGKLFTIDLTGDYAINQAGEAFRLYDKPKKSRFK